MSDRPKNPWVSGLKCSRCGAYTMRRGDDGDTAYCVSTDCYNVGHTQPIGRPSDEPGASLSGTGEPTLPPTWDEAARADVARLDHATTDAELAEALRGLRAYSPSACHWMLNLAAHRFARSTGAPTQASLGEIERLLDEYRDAIKRNTGGRNLAIDAEECRERLLDAIRARSRGRTP